MEETRTDQYLPIFENEQWTYILNSKDLCMIEHIADLAKAGISSLKIEGRAKSAFYVASITNAYRLAIDFFKRGESLPDWVKEEVLKVSHRDNCTGYFYGSPAETSNQNYGTSSYIRNYDVVAVIEKCEGGVIFAEQRNRFFPNDELEILSPVGNNKNPDNPEKPVKISFSEIFDENGEPVLSANKAKMKLQLPFGETFPAGSYIRKCIMNNV
jgi:putative protease